MPAHKRIRCKITYQPNDKDWYISLYAKNIGDDVYIGTWAAASALQGGAQFATYTDPRTWAVMFGKLISNKIDKKAVLTAFFLLH